MERDFLGLNSKIVSMALKEEFEDTSKNTGTLMAPRLLPLPLRFLCFDFSVSISPFRFLCFDFFVSISLFRFPWRLSLKSPIYGNYFGGLDI